MLSKYWFGFLQKTFDQKRPSHWNTRIQESINQVKVIPQQYAENPALGFVTHKFFNPLVPGVH